MSSVLPFIIHVESQWAAIARSGQVIPNTISSTLDLEHGKLCIEIEWRGYIALITAWENASCLDIDVLNISSKEGVILASGPCDDPSEAPIRLLLLCDYIRESFSNA
jgi:hypothetical protein